MLSQILVFTLLMPPTSLTTRPCPLRSLPLHGRPLRDANAVPPILSLGDLLLSVTLLALPLGALLPIPLPQLTAPHTWVPNWLRSLLSLLPPHLTRNLRLHILPHPLHPQSHDFNALHTPFLLALKSLRLPCLAPIKLFAVSNASFSHTNPPFVSLAVAGLPAPLRILS